MQYELKRGSRTLRLRRKLRTRRASGVGLWVWLAVALRFPKGLSGSVMRISVCRLLFHDVIRIFAVFLFPYTVLRINASDRGGEGKSA